MNPHVCRRLPDAIASLMLCVLALSSATAGASDAAWEQQDGQGENLFETRAAVPATLGLGAGLLPFEVDTEVLSDMLVQRLTDVANRVALNALDATELGNVLEDVPEPLLRDLAESFLLLFARGGDAETAGEAVLESLARLAVVEVVAGALVEREGDTVTVDDRQCALIALRRSGATAALFATVGVGGSSDIESACDPDRVVLRVDLLASMRSLHHLAITQAQRSVLVNQVETALTELGTACPGVVDTTDVGSISIAQIASRAAAARDVDMSGGTLGLACEVRLREFATVFERTLVDIATRLDGTVTLDDVDQMIRDAGFADIERLASDPAVQSVWRIARALAVEQTPSSADLRTVLVAIRAILPATENSTLSRDLFHALLDVAISSLSTTAASDDGFDAALALARVVDLIDERREDDWAMPRLSVGFGYLGYEAFELGSDGAVDTDSDNPFASAGAVVVSAGVMFRPCPQNNRCDTGICFGALIDPVSVVIPMAEPADDDEAPTVLDDRQAQLAFSTGFVARAFDLVDITATYRFGYAGDYQGHPFTPMGLSFTVELPLAEYLTELRTRRGAVVAAE